MKIVIMKKLWEKILLSSLFILSFGRSAQGETFSGWGGIVEQPIQPELTDPTLAVINLVKLFILTPLLIIAVLIYGTHFYYKIRKKNINYNLKRLFNLGERSIFLLIISYITIYAVRLSETNSSYADMYEIGMYVILFIGLLALVIYILLFILFIKQIIYYFTSKNLKNNNNKDD